MIEGKIMDDRTVAKKELMKKKIGELRKIAGRCHIEIKPTWTKDIIAKLIIERRFAMRHEIKDKAQARKDPQPAGQQPAGPPGVNTEFEKAAHVAEQPAKQEKRGGVREGAGMPPGLTHEKAKVKNLPQYPSNPIKQGSQALFDLWASVAKIEELALSEDEADLLSLPITQLAEFYFPGMIPEIAGTWVMMIFAVTRVVQPRMKLIDKVRKQRRAAAGDIRTGPAQGGNGMLYHFKTQDGGPLHAVAAGDPFKNTTDYGIVTCETCKSILRNQGVSI